MAKKKAVAKKKASVKKANKSDLFLVLDGEVYLREGRKKTPIEGEIVLKVLMSAIERGIRETISRG